MPDEKDKLITAIIQLARKFAKLYDFKLGTKLQQQMKKRLELKSIDELSRIRDEDVYNLEIVEFNIKAGARIRCCANTDAGHRCSKVAAWGDYVCKLHIGSPVKNSRREELGVRECWERTPFDVPCKWPLEAPLTMCPFHADLKGVDERDQLIDEARQAMDEWKGGF